MIERYSRPAMSMVWSQENKIAKWLEVELAACEAWSELGVVPAASLPELRKATCDLAKMREIEAKVHHEVTAFLAAVTETVGGEGRYIHYGLNSSDVIDTAMSLQVREASQLLLHDVDELVAALTALALRHKDTPMMGRTHGVHAEPITFGFKVAVWVDEMRRNRERLSRAAETMSYGKISGAVGTHANVPPQIEEAVCARLNLKPCPVSTQIIQRDRHAEFITTLAIVGATLEKIALEFRGLQKTEVLEVEEPFAEGQQGSSAMPHKRNPELCERVCGLSRVLRGYAVTALENVALWHERDISHSSTERIIFPEGCGLLDYMLSLMINVVSGLQVYPDHMLRNIDVTHGLVFSQRVLLALVEKGLDRGIAYKAVQRNAMRAWKEETPFLDLLLTDGDVTSVLGDAELRSLFDLSYHLRYVASAFERLGLA